MDLQSASTNEVPPAGLGTPVTDGQPAEQQSAPEPTLEESFAAEMGNDSPADFLTSFLEGEGLIPEAQAQTPNAQPDGVPPVQSAPGNGQGQVGQPSANGQLPAAPPNGQTQGVDPNQLSRLMGGAPVSPVPPVPGPQGPNQAPQMAPQPASQTQSGQQGDEPEWTPFTAAFQIPDQIAQAMEHEDPRVRMNAIGSVIAAAGNKTALDMMGRLRSHIIPEITQQVRQQVRMESLQERMVGDILKGRPQLRLVAPHVLQNAAQIVIQDEARANPNFVYNEEIGNKIGILAMEAARQLAGGVAPAPVPQFQQPPAPVQQQQIYPVTQPTQGNDGNWYVRLNTGQRQMVQPPPQMMQQQPQQQQPQPWMAGQNAGGFGPPAAPAATPDSEFASFMNGGWG